MTKVYHNTPELIIIEKLLPKKEVGGINIQDRLINVIGGGRQRIYQAHEIWMYDPPTRMFSYYKNRRGAISLLHSFFADKGINLRRECVDGMYDDIPFETDKDLFLFNLKFE